MTFKSYVVRPMRISIVADGRAKRFAKAKIETPKDWDEVARYFARNDGKERFIVGLLNSVHHLLAVNIVSVGTINASLVHPREVFRPAIIQGATAVVVAHNHPSGDVTPSHEDKETTKRLVQASRIIGIPILDHVIIAHDKLPYSFRQNGLMD